MALTELKEEVWKANLELVGYGLVVDTFGNVSGRDRIRQQVVIKPSGVPYDRMSPEDMVVLDLSGRILEGNLRPSSDTDTHLEIYRSWPEINGVAHTHSPYATAWAQARREIPCLGTTHADYFFGPVPVTEVMTPEEIRSDYEKNTGKVIVRRLENISPLQMPAVLVANHGPFCWGGSAGESARTAFLLEQVARMAYLSRQLQPDGPSIAEDLLQRHFLRKHGSSAYYGQ
jgi:L-ribulose-5-phosphate 4-epimerase